MAGKNIVNNKINNVSLPARKNRIAIVDDHPVVLEGLAQLVNRENDLIVCVKADNEKEVFDAIRKQQVDLVVVDMLLKKTSGVQVTEKLKAQYPSLHILILSMSDDRHHVKGAFQAGARGYITKDEVSEKIIAGIRKVLKGRIYISKKLSQKFSRQTIVSWILEADAKDTLDKV
jgi:DNA-binding NarL/FixJ family response regulator